MVGGGEWEQAVYDEGVEFCAGELVFEEPGDDFMAPFEGC